MLIITTHQNITAGNCFDWATLIACPLREKSKICWRYDKRPSLTTDENTDPLTIETNPENSIAELLFGLVQNIFTRSARICTFQAVVVFKLERLPFGADTKIHVTIFVSQHPYMCRVIALAWCVPQFENRWNRIIAIEGFVYTNQALYSSHQEDNAQNSHKTIHGALLSLPHL